MEAKQFIKITTILLCVFPPLEGIRICVLVNSPSSFLHTHTHTPTPTHTRVCSLAPSFSSVLQATVCYWFGIDLGVICCHLIKNSLAKLLDIRTAGNVIFVNVFNHIFNKTADAHHKRLFLSLLSWGKSAQSSGSDLSSGPGSRTLDPRRVHLARTQHSPVTLEA